MQLFKIWRDGIWPGWAYFYYRNENGIGETKYAGNPHSQWEVGEIPTGAILC